MSDATATVAAIHHAFGTNQYPGDRFLVGSSEGCEPEEEIAPFRGQHDWATLEAASLDAHSAALSFFSEAAFRFFLPAYLVADVRGLLNTADPVFHLTHGFSTSVANVPVGARIFKRLTGKSRLMNPARYGAMTFEDHARFRLSVFTKEEASAIVEYLRFRQSDEPTAGGPIEAALTAYWLDRVRTAPSAEALKRHTEEEEAFLEALKAGSGS
jgi:hypothetical protein